MKHDYLAIAIIPNAGTFHARLGLSYAGQTIIYWCNKCGCVMFNVIPKDDPKQHKSWYFIGSGFNRSNEEPECIKDKVEKLKDHPKTLHQMVQEKIAQMKKRNGEQNG